MHRSAGDKDAALEGVSGLAAEPIGDRRQQAVARNGGLAADMQKCKSPGAVGSLDHPGGETGLADRRRLLIPGHRRDRQRRAEEIFLRRAEIGAGVEHFGEQCRRDAKGVEKFLVPGEPSDIEQHRAGGVGDVGRMAPPGGEPP